MNYLAIISKYGDESFARIELIGERFRDTDARRRFLPRSSNTSQRQISRLSSPFDEFKYNRRRARNSR